MKTESLPVDDVAHIRAHLAAGPQMKRFLDDQISDAVVALDQLRHFARGLRGRNIRLAFRRLREESHARNVLAQNGNDRQAERLINIRDEFVAGQILERRFVRLLLLERQMPILVALAPPQILQAAPELVRLLDAANFRAPREFRLGGKLDDELAEGFLEAVGELLVVE